MTDNCNGMLDDGDTRRSETDESHVVVGGEDCENSVKQSGVI